MTLSPEEPTYYEQWGPIRRRWRRLFDAVSLVWTRKPTVLLECKWRLGDEIMASSMYAALAEGLALDKDEYQLVVWCNYPELLLDHPNITAVNQKDIRPQMYMNLRGVPRDENRRHFYLRYYSTGSVLTAPRLYYKDWSTVLLDEIPAGDGSVVALCRGASWETKRWNVNRWKELGEALEARGCRVIVLGQEGESIPVGTDFTGRTDVREAACMLHHADLTISNDSGLMHLSLAADTKTIGLFGPTDPAILIENDERFVPLTNDRDCQGCWNRDLSIVEPGVCPKNITDCMEPIALERVLLAVDEKLGVSK